MNNDKEQITSNEKSEDVLADLSKDEHSGEETSSPESSGKKTFTDTDGSDSVNADVAAKPSILRRIILIAAICVFCYSAFMLFQIFWEYKKGNDIYDTIQNHQLLSRLTMKKSKFRLYMTISSCSPSIPKDLAIFTFLQLMYGFRWSSLQIMIFI